MLLVLDNFEQVIDAAPSVDALLLALPEPGGPDEQPQRAAHLGRAGVPGSAARPAGSRRTSRR